MSNMREIKNRMKSIRETRQITKAMKLISAAKLKKARTQLEATLPFFEKVKLTMADILTHSAVLESAWVDTREAKSNRRKGFVVLAGDKSLAGGYNHNLLSFAESVIRKDENPLIFVAGHLGRGHFVRNRYDVDPEFEFPVQNPSTYRARDMADQVLDKYRKGEIDEVWLVYTHMHSAIRTEPVAVKLLPLDLGAVLKDIQSTFRHPEQHQAEAPDQDMNYEPSPAAVFDVLVPKYIKGIFYGALVEAFTSEQSARMAAMDNATANADDMLARLTLYYNRARQAVITQEISEIVGGASALK